MIDIGKKKAGIYLLIEKDKIHHDVDDCKC